MGQGYRVIAHSSGLRPDEVPGITRHAPSGDGLCDSGEEAEGLAFFKLPVTGRFCVMRSHYDGKEPTGRGGQRAYTRAFILDAAAMQRFRNNPFDVLRVASTNGHLEANVNSEQTLPKLTLSASVPPSTESILAMRKNTGHRRLCRLLDPILSGETLILANDGDLGVLAEALLLILPVPLRATFTFTTGLRFSPTREVKLAALREQQAQLQPCLAGRPLRYDDLRIKAENAPAATHEWARAAERLIDVGRSEELISLTSQRFAEADLPAIHRIGQICIARYDLPTASADQILRLLTNHIPQTTSSPLEIELDHDLARNAHTRLTTLLPGADQVVLRSAWQHLVHLQQTPPEWKDLICDITCKTLARMCRISLPEAIQMTLQASWLDPASPLFIPLRSSLLRRVQDWRPNASAEEQAAMRQLLNAWQMRFPSDPELAETITALNTPAEPAVTR